MRDLAVRLIAVLIAFCPLISNAFQGEVTLTSRDDPYFAAVTLKDAGLDANGKRKVSYQINLKSNTCVSVITGNAAYYADSDDNIDSEFLPNGEVVKTKIFKDNGRNGDVTLTMDVESKKPRFASIGIEHPLTVKGGCVKEGGDGWLFFDWRGIPKSK